MANATKSGRTHKFSIAVIRPTSVGIVPSNAIDQKSLYARARGYRFSIEAQISMTSRNRAGSRTFQFP